MPDADEAIHRLEQSTRYTDRLVVAMCKLLQAQEKVERARTSLEETVRAAMQSTLEYIENGPRR
jgi:hypothetical protein